MNPPVDFQDLAGIVLNKVIGWLTIFIKMLPNLVVAVIVLIIIWLLSIPAGRSVKRWVLRFSKREHIAKLISRVVRLGVITGGIVLALDVLNLDKAVASLLAGMGIIGLAITFASQDIASNFMAGLLLTFIRPFRTGDLIQSKDFFGYVEEIDMRSTVGRSYQGGERVILPNKAVLGNPIINYTVSGQRRIELTGTVLYKNNLQLVEEVAVKAVESVELRDPKRPIEFLYKEFSSNAIHFVVRFWTGADQETVVQAQNGAIKAIKQAFDDHEIAVAS